MHRFLPAIAIVLLLGACGDRRQSDDAAAAGSNTPAGERVATTPEGAAEPEPAGAQSPLPPAAPPPSDPLCAEMTGDARDTCLRDAAERASRAPHESTTPPPEPTPTPTPTR